MGIVGLINYRKIQRRFSLIKEFLYIIKKKFSKKYQNERI